MYLICSLTLCLRLFNLHFLRYLKLSIFNKVHPISCINTLHEYYLLTMIGSFTEVIQHSLHLAFREVSKYSEILEKLHFLIYLSLHGVTNNNLILFLIKNSKINFYFALNGCSPWFGRVYFLPSNMSRISKGTYISFFLNLSCISNIFSCKFKKSISNF